MAAFRCMRRFSTSSIRNGLGANRQKRPMYPSFVIQDDVLEEYRHSPLLQNQEIAEKPAPVDLPREFKHVYPEFLPNPLWNRRDRVREMLERNDMYKRREHIDIPEFYVGTIMAVTVADQYAPGKKNCFVGICIDRGGDGLRAYCILRNCVDGLGVEIMYELYNPMLQSIEVLRLEKRLDDRLFYLRDAPNEYSTTPFDIEAVPQPKGSQVPVNTVKVKLNERPWHERWERQNLQGVEDLGLPQRFYDRAKELAEPWVKYDLMKTYRNTINDEHTTQIMAEVYRKTEKSRAQKKYILSKKK